MKTNYKKIVVALQTGIMASLICVSVSNHASDVELYKAPKSSQTTIMFMIDLSGSMLFCDRADGTVNEANNCSPNRISKLKDGMLTLLRGSPTKGIDPLPDKLIAGLSEFSSPSRNGPFGRIKVEARPLGELVDMTGTRQLYRVVRSVSVQPQTGIRTNTKEATTTQTRAQTGTRARNCTTTDGTTTGGSRYCNVSTVTNWTNSTNNWSPRNVTEPSGSGTDSDSWSNNGSPIVSGPTTEECIAWDSSYNCTSWRATTKTVDDFIILSSRDTTSSTYGNASPSGSASSPIRVVTETPITYSTGSCTNNSTSCSRTASITTNIVVTTTTPMQRNETTTKTTTYTGTAQETHRARMISAIEGLTAVGGTPSAYAYAEVAAYMMGQTTAGVSGAGSMSGFSPNVQYITDATKYIAPVSINKTKQCNTQGIYFLTDGEPTYYDTSSTNASNQHRRATLESFMKKSLGTTKGASFNCDNDSTLGKFTSGYSTASKMTQRNGWDCIGAYTKALLNSKLNPAEVSIKTAVVGFGNDFSNKTSSDEKDADKWGILGGGGSYIGSDDEAIIISVREFLKKIQKYIPPVTTGSVTIPVDNLDTQNIQPWAYFPQFDPQPDAQVTTWLGNLKKYQILNNILKDRDGGKVVDETTGVSVDNPNDYWADQSVTKMITKVKYFTDGSDEEEEIEVRVGGTLSHFRLGNVSTDSTNIIERRLFTDRKISVASNNSVAIGTIDNDKNLTQIKTADLKVNNATNHFSKDVKRGYIAALFGYDVPLSIASVLTTADAATNIQQRDFNNHLIQANAKLRQMGAVMHSKPILITQEGKQSYTDEGDLTYVDRDDLIVFGSTQGLLHVVRAGESETDSNAGKEVFTFVPNEMIEKQYLGFLNQKDQGSNLMYGIDGQWTAYTEYVTKKDTRSENRPQELTVTVKGGKQWLYGGLRMGGKSYYALDLTDVTSSQGTPKLKFRVDPENADAYTPLSYMGQSWSKPTLTWVNWKGSRKLVMLVGGGYDPMYENFNYKPSSSIIDQGAGVYMFDADNGDLLWWASANASSIKKTETYAANMNRSVVSQIKAIDRNNDGLTDHLYFGDLGGQVWRVDLNASSNAGFGENLATRVVRLMDMSGAEHVPRFYSTPTFTIHNANNGLFSAVTIGSGDLSSPMSAPNKNDALYVIYDKDVTRRNLPVLKESELFTVDLMSDELSTADKNAKKMVKKVESTSEVNMTYGGWYYPLSAKHRILNDNVAIVNTLYVSVFDSTVDIDDVDCYGGVRGQSIAKQFCLPFGKCATRTGSDDDEGNPDDDIFLGKGNIGISFGGKDKKRGLVLNLSTSATLKQYQGKNKFISQRWYER